MPAAQGMMTRRVSEREQGELQGAIGSLRSLAFVIGPGLFSWTFAWFINPHRSFHLPGAPYYLAGCLLLSASLLATRIQKPALVAASATDRQQVISPEVMGSLPTAPWGEGFEEKNR